MMKRRLGMVWLSAMSAVFVGGCAGAEGNDLGAFIGDFLGSALAAFLL